MTAQRLVVWRHGRTAWNHTGRFQGQADIGLDDLGQAQAKASAQLLARYDPTQIVSSDLVRAQSTAAALAEVTGLPVSLDARLREIHVGTWEGLTGEQTAAADPQLAGRLAAGEDVRRSPTGETVAEVADRVTEAFAELTAAAPDGSTIVATMHGMAARVGICHFVGLPPELWNRWGSLENCAWATVARHRSGSFWRVEEYNVTGFGELTGPIS